MEIKTDWWEARHGKKPEEYKRWVFRVHWKDGTMTTYEFHGTYETAAQLLNECLRKHHIDKKWIDYIKLIK